MKHLVMLVGPPGSGKSTLSKMYEDFVRVSQDDQGRDGHMDLFETSILEGKDVIVDRMNFNKEQRDRYLSIAKKAGYYTEIIVKHVPYVTCFERVMARQDHPTIKDDKAARSALNLFFTKYERVEESEADRVVRLYGEIGDTRTHQKVVVCDLDGTMCNINHRLHYVKKEGKKDWKGFFSDISGDSVNEWCNDTVRGLESAGYGVVFLSGRPDDHERATKQWLKKHGWGNYPVYMRHRGDFREDFIVKEMLLDFEVLTRYVPKIFIDDRQQVVDMWRKRGFVCLQCDKGDF